MIRQQHFCLHKPSCMVLGLQCVPFIAVLHHQRTVPSVCTYRDVDPAAEVQLNLNSNSQNML